MRVLVIGSGLAGVATAFFLNRNGCDVTVVERRQGAALETSFANAGMLTPSMADPWNAPGVLWKVLKWIGRDDSPLLLRPSALPTMISWGLGFLANSSPQRFTVNMSKNARIASYSLGVLRQLRTELDLHYDERVRGTIKIFRERAAFDEMVEIAHKLAAEGITHEALDTAGVIEAEPSLAPIADKLVGGVLFPGDESGDAHKCCRAIAEAAQKRGVTFRFEVTVSGFDRNGGRIAAVLTDQGPLEADAYVLAAGSYSPLLARHLGLNIPIRPVKGYSITVPCGDWQGAPLRPIVDDTVHIAVTPLGQRLRVAGTAEFAGWDTVVRGPRIEYVRRLLLDILPDAAPFLSAPIEEWAGLRPMCCDGVPILGRTPIANLYLNTGHGHLGWTMSQGSGKLVADLIAGGKPQLDLADYRLGRFD